MGSQLCSNLQRMGGIFRPQMPPVAAGCSAGPKPAAYMHHASLASTSQELLNSKTWKLWTAGSTVVWRFILWGLVAFSPLLPSRAPPLYFLLPIPPSVSHYLTIHLERPSSPASFVLSLVSDFIVLEIRFEVKLHFLHTINKTYQNIRCTHIKVRPTTEPLFLTRIISDKAFSSHLYIKWSSWTQVF